MLTKRVLFPAIFSLVLGAAKPAEPPFATVSVKTAPLGTPIPKNFIGLSLEVSTKGEALPVPPEAQQLATEARPQGEYVYALGRPGDPNRAYFQFMRNLGATTLRLGGNSQDNTCWDKSTAPDPSRCQGEILPGDLQLFSLAARETGWHLILGLNLKQNSPQWVLKEITQGVARTLKPGEISALEIGNEPSLFPHDGSRPRSYSPAEHVKEFLGYARALQADPAAKKFALAGPAACCAWENTRDLETFLDGVRQTNLKVVTVHEYVTTVCGGRKVSIPQLLAAATTAPFIKRAEDWVRAARARHLPIALAETNSTSCGGMPGVSNSFVSALWGLDYIFQVAEDSFNEIDFHTSYKTGGSAYNPVVTVGSKGASGRWRYTNTAQPIYYAMYMFARNAEGKYFLPTSIETRGSVQAYAVSACAGCRVNVFVINKDLTAGGQVRVHGAGQKAAASLLLLQAPSLSATASDVRYGGTLFDHDGHLPPQHVVKVRPDAHGDYAFDLPNASAAMLTIAAPRSQAAPAARE